MKYLFIALLLFAGISRTNAQQPADAANKMLTAYYGLKNALVADNTAEAKTQAKELLANISTFPADKLDAAQLKNWNTYKEKLEFDSRHISETAAIAHQREHFESLSKNMYQVVSALKLNNAAVYYQFCPMKKATWLSETAAIKNPYFGKQMLTCGKTTETIPAKK
ncbi:DUF3347 domain-containing protein [Mucilaginibacter ginkgonis]|uniref:DUF3347 domain-containing protein n=1 Tax=Mucilaginibacter ginkgonis TaxID=2682091 RepID=A0A6I4IMG3_9SPHI|nr:DUF3347 domain-containing protein [Mucilaginibacter ginkgonis]QQL50390.1 DUF3347 domain-containing protein [Mucilaginibacter ginkgonis]